MPGRLAQTSMRALFRGFLLPAAVLPILAWLVHGSRLAAGAAGAGSSYPGARMLADLIEALSGDRTPAAGPLVAVVFGLAGAAASFFAHRLTGNTIVSLTAGALLVTHPALVPAV